MKVKRILCLSLCTVLAFSSLTVGSSAKDSAAEKVPFVINAVERISGTAISVFSRVWNTLFKRSETDIPSPSVNEPSWTACDREAIADPEQTLNAETWVMKEVSFISEKAYADPFTEVELSLHLFGNGRLYVIPAFWDGGNVWKARFVCPSEGVWSFETVCSDAENSGLHSRTGKVVCTAYSGEYDVYKHGFVTADSGKKYFTYDDGTPFFYLGDTHWSLGEETVDMVETICEKRASQGFTVIQSEPIGAAFDFTNGITSDDLQGLADYDKKFEIIASHGLVHANAQFFLSYFMEPLIINNGGYTQDGKISESAKLYLERACRYWVARYGAYPVMWTLGQEVDDDFYYGGIGEHQWNIENHPYKLAAEYISEYDAYDHPLSAHQENAGATAAYGNGEGASDECKVYYKNASPSAFRDVEAHNFYAAQWQTEKDKQFNFDVVKDYWFNSQGKPAINYEGHYCYLWTKNFGSRMQGWTAYLNGMYGYGWGAHDTWSYLNVFDEENDSTDGVDIITSEEKINATWQDALEYESSYQVGYMRQFLEKTEWYNLIPRFDNKSYFFPALNVYYAFASNESNTEIVIYFYSFTDPSVAQNSNTTRYGGLKTGTVGRLEPFGRYTYQWFDPITGTYFEKEEFTASALGTYYIGSKPQATDMVLLIKACE